MVFDASLLNSQYYKVLIKGKCNNLDIGEAPSPTTQGSNYWNKSLWVTLKYGQPT